MRVNKKIIIITLILISLFMIGTTSAATDTDIVNSDVTQKISHKDNVANKNIDTISKKKNVNTKKENNNDKISSNKNKNILKADEKTFTDLQTNITNAGDNAKTITLKNDYIQNDESAITIGGNQKITINGNGYTLDAKGKSRIFTVYGELILKNLKLINGKCDNKYGGAINTANTNLTIINCTLINNTANDYGGAIYAKNCNINITNSNLTNNTANYGYGGAIHTYVNCNVTITGSKLTQNNADCGGAIQLEQNCNLNITNSNLTQNNATWNGGAIDAMNTCHITITSSKITQNNANVYGGAINTEDTCHVTITSSKLTQNNADYGGAIHIYARSKLNLTSSLFMDNTAGGNGSAIYGNCFDDLTVNHNIFLNNTGDNVIYLYNDTECNFVYNLDYNWFDNNATDYTNTPNVKSNIENLDFNNWLFLNATANPDPDSVQVLSSSNITFDLYLYNSSSKNVTVYDYSWLKPVNLTIDYNPNIDKSFALLGEKISYTASSLGIDSVTARISNVEYSIKLEITQIPTNITIDTDTITLNVTDTAQIHAKLEPSGAGSLNYTSSNESVVTVDSNGNITAVGQGIANITVSFAGEGDYAAATNKTILVTVNLNPASVSVNNNTLDLFVGDEFNIVVVTDPEGLNVTYILDNSGVASIDENGKITALKEGKTQIIIKINGERVYFENSTTINLTVSKIPTTINIENNKITINATENITTGATLNPITAGSLKYTSNDTRVVTVRDGKIIAIGAGVAKITVSFTGNKKYASAVNKTILVTVNLKEINTQITSLTIPNELFKGKTSNITGTLTANDNKLANQKITIIITNNHGYKETFTGKTDANGKFNIKIKPNVNGPITITTTYNGHKTNKYNYKQASKSTNRNVQKVIYNIKLDTLQPSYNYNTKVNITGQITNNYQPLDVKNVNITINDIRKTVTLNNKGKFKYTSPYTTTGLYKVLLNCSGTTQNTQYFIKYPTKFTIQKIPDTTTNKAIIIIIKESNKFTGTVNVKIGKQDYKVQLTNGKGKQKIKINTSGTYTASIKFTGNQKYTKTSTNSNKFTVKYPTRFTISKIPNIKTGSQIKLTVCEKNKYTGSVTVTIGSETYTVKLNKGTGKKTITPKLSPGTYNAKIRFNGDKKYSPSNSVSNKFQVTPKQVVKVDTKIIAFKKTFYVEDTNKKYNISLKDANGKIVKNAQVTLKVKGKTYKTKTNNKGIATFDLNNLDQKGQYNTLIKYAGDKNYKASNKKIKITVKIRFKTVGKGSKDKKTVKKIQKALKKNGYYLHAGKYYLKIDGIYYNWTQKEAQRYQKNNKLPVTGKVDYYTAIKLGII